MTQPKLTSDVVIELLVEHSSKLSVAYGEHLRQALQALVQMVLQEEREQVKADVRKAMGIKLEGM